MIIILNIQRLCCFFLLISFSFQQSVLHISHYWLVLPRQVPGVIQFCATDYNSESILARSFSPVRKQWLLRLRAEIEDLHSLQILLLHMTYEPPAPLCKVNWGLASFKPSAGNWPLCSRYGLDGKKKNENCLALPSSRLWHPVKGPQGTWCSQGTVRLQHRFPIKSSCESEFVMGAGSIFQRDGLSCSFNFRRCLLPHL